MIAACRSAGLAVLCFLILCPVSHGEDALGLRVPAGFEVTEFADSNLANDIFSLTIDPRGRVVVSGRGYIRILVDDNHDGRADRAISFADGPKDGAQGLLCEATSLFITGDGGLRRYRDENGDDKADGPSELIRAMKTGGEHDAHDIRRGPDGWLYVLCGNSTGIDKSFAQSPSSPVKEPVAGCVVRFSPDLRTSEIVAHGFRNAYRMDFNLDGELFTFDSDNERCVSLPWYEGTRFYHVIPGGHHGWLSPQLAQWWRRPPYLCDVIAPVADLGRGSPTGLVCYRHTQFPEKYRGGFFLLDWTFGKIHHASLRDSGSTYTAAQEVFIESTGDNGFAPTDAAVDPNTGDLYVAIGGRGTRGAVYRVRHTEGARAAGRPSPIPLPVPARSLDWQPEKRARLVEEATSSPGRDRLNALNLILRHRERFAGDQLLSLIRANMGHADRYIRLVTVDLIRSLEKPDRAALGEAGPTPMQQLVYCMAICPDQPEESLTRVCRVLGKRHLSRELRLLGVRVLQLALGDMGDPRRQGTVWEGYTPGRANLDRASVVASVAALRPLLGSDDADLEREVARTLAVLEDDSPATRERIASHWATSSDPIEDIHYLIVLARLWGMPSGDKTSPLTHRVTDALLGLDSKITARRLNRDRHWPLRIAELHRRLAQQDFSLNLSLVTHPDFGRPDHVLFAECPDFDRAKAAELFLARAEKDANFTWSAPLVGLVGSRLSERSAHLLRKLWDEAGLEEAILPALARMPQAVDRDKFVQGLTSPQPATVLVCLEALEKLPPRSDGDTLLPLVRALRNLPDGPEGNTVRQRVAKYLQRLTGQGEIGTDKEAWAAWFAKAHPELAARMGGSDSIDVAGWQRRLEALDWSKGEAERGRMVFAKASCAACHSGSQAVGPDLHGVAGRFSRADLFTAIVQPNKDISPRYRSSVVTTDAGKVYQGLVIYEAVDSLILQTGATTTVRLAGGQVAGKRPSDTSLMPAGLLDKHSDKDIADLYAYLKTLTVPPQASGKRR